jgi:hypothetical protein
VLDDRCTWVRWIGNTVLDDPVVLVVMNHHDAGRSPDATVLWTTVPSDGGNRPSRNGNGTSRSTFILTTDPSETPRESGTVASTATLEKTITAQTRADGTR